MLPPVSGVTWVGRPATEANWGSGREHRRLSHKAIPYMRQLEVFPNDSEGFPIRPDTLPAGRFGASRDGVA